jgi:4'-phosphopantetheinyl transferase
MPTNDPINVLWPSAAAGSELRVDDAQVWAVPLDWSSVAKSWEVLSPDECERAERFRLEEPRRRFVNTRAALRTLLGEYLGVPAAEVAFSYEASGKPRLREEVNWNALRFNLAHSDNLALVVVAREGDVGIDVERLRVVDRWEQIARRYFHEAEVDEIFGSADALRGAAFLRCWTAKEAIVKAIGTGLNRPLSSFRVPVTSDEWVNVPTPGGGAPTRCWLQHLTPSDEYVAAVACADIRPRIECCTLHFRSDMQ